MSCEGQIEHGQATWTLPSERTGTSVKLFYLSFCFLFSVSRTFILLLSTHEARSDSQLAQDKVRESRHGNS